MRLLSIGFAAISLSACAGQPGQPDLASRVAVPMDLTTGRPVIEIELNGQGPYHVIMDTGAAGNGIISHEIALALGLEKTGTEQVGSPLGGVPVDAEIYRLDTVTVGGAVAEDVQILAIVDDPMTDVAGDGVMGPFLFRNTLVTFDFVNNLFVIGGEAPADVNWVQFGKDAPLLDIDLYLNGEAIAAHIDTGTPHVLSLPDAYAETLTFADPVQVIGRARTIDREFEVRGAKLNEDITAGDATIPVEMVTFGPLPVANLGSGGMRGLTLTIDWPNERFALTGLAEPVMPQPRRERVQQSGVQANTSE